MRDDHSWPPAIPTVPHCCPKESFTQKFVGWTATKELTIWGGRIGWCQGGSDGQGDLVRKGNLRNQKAFQTLGGRREMMDAPCFCSCSRLPSMPAGRFSPCEIWQRIHQWWIIQCTVWCRQTQARCWPWPLMGPTLSAAGRLFQLLLLPQCYPKKIEQSFTTVQK